MGSGYGYMVGMGVGVCLDTHGYTHAIRYIRFIEPTFGLSPEKTNLFLWLCDLLSNCTQQHSFRSHFFSSSTTVRWVISPSPLNKAFRVYLGVVLLPVDSSFFPHGPSLPVLDKRSVRPLPRRSPLISAQATRVSATSPTQATSASPPFASKEVRTPHPSFCLC